MPARSAPEAATAGLLRVLASTEPGAWPGPELATDLPRAEALPLLADIGWLPGVRAKECLGYADPIVNESGRPNGIPVWLHPIAQLRDDPQLWRIWDEWRLGYMIEPERSELGTLSHWHIECLSVLRMARSRSLERRRKVDVDG